MNLSNLTRADANTILAALHLYLHDGNGDPGQRTNILHEIACGEHYKEQREDISLDDDGIEALQRKVLTACDAPPRSIEVGKATRGPWTSDPSKSFYVFGPDGSVICNANTQANQVFIREAPEMADALQVAKPALTATIPLLIKLGDYIANADQRCETILQVRAAIDEAGAVLVNAGARQ